jgi:hypothetical protein
MSTSDMAKPDPKPQRTTDSDVERWAAAGVSCAVPLSNSIRTVHSLRLADDGWGSPFLCRQEPNSGQSTTSQRLGRRLLVRVGTLVCPVASFAPFFVITLLVLPACFGWRCSDSLEASYFECISNSAHLKSLTKQCDL